MLRGSAASVSISSDLGGEFADEVAPTLQPVVGEGLDCLGEPGRVEVHDAARGRLQDSALALEVVERVGQRVVERDAGEVVEGGLGGLEVGFGAFFIPTRRRPAPRRSRRRQRLRGWR